MVKKTNLSFNKHSDLNQMKVSDLKSKLNVIYQAGGKDKIKKQHDKGKLTARERIEYLKDKNAPFYEVGAFAGYNMYQELGGCVSGGVIGGIITVSGKKCVVVANDATIKAGAWFPITAKKNLRLQEIAIENKLPIIYLVDSAGVYLPMQDEIFPDKEHFGRMFRNNAIMSAMGITQISAVMGSCVAGGAYLPIMSDEAMIVEGTGSIYLAGPYLVRAAIGEQVDNETLGGATTHSEISGVTDYKCKDDKSCLDKIKYLMSLKGETEEKAGFNRIEAIEPEFNVEDIYGILPDTTDKPYNVKDIVYRLVDKDSFEEYKAQYGKTIICGYARVDGWAVGIVANQRIAVKSKTGEMQFGGVIYSDSADKSARFIMNCNQKNIPLLFLQDVTGFMVGSKSEHGGIIKDGAKMVNAQANSIVPKFTVVMGNSFGAGNYAMCGKAYDPRFMLAWPNSKLAVMSGASAAKTLLQIEISKRKARGEKISEKEEKELLDNIKNSYAKQISPYYAAARLWTDAIIAPIDTRQWISMGIELANYNKTEKKYSTGVIQV